MSKILLCLPDYLSKEAMARRMRNSRAWRYVLSGVRRESDSRTFTTASGTHGWSSDTDGQVKYGLFSARLPKI